MIETIVKCDKCYKPGAKCYRFETGCSMDPSGNGYNTDYTYIDLCFDHLYKWILEHPETKIKECVTYESVSNR